MKKIISLDAAKEGAIVKVIDFERRIPQSKGFHFIRRIQEMGITKGEIIEVERNSGIGPIQIKVKGTHIALGRGISSKIIVETEID